MFYLFLDVRKVAELWYGESFIHKDKSCIYIEVYHPSPKYYTNIIFSNPSTNLYIILIYTDIDSFSIKDLLDGGGTYISVWSLSRPNLISVAYTATYIKVSLTCKRLASILFSSFESISYCQTSWTGLPEDLHSTIFLNPSLK